MVRRKYLGEILMDIGAVTKDQVASAMAKQKESGKKVGEILLEEGLVHPADITYALARQFNYPMVDLDNADIPPATIELIPRSMSRENNIVPVVKDGSTIVLAISNPLDFALLDKMRFALGAQVEIALASPDAIRRLLNRHYGIQEDEVVEQLEQITEDIYMTNLSETETDDDEEAPIIKLVHLLITQAIKSRASDIHVEPLPGRLRIRYRVDGVCYEIEPAPKKRLQAAIISRIKIMSKMDIAEKRKPQDGKIRLRILGKEIDIRVSTLPGSAGESVVMRILNKESVLLGIEHLGFHATDYQVFQSIIKRPHGIMLVTGPTGSGKTTTLYAALNELNTPTRKIITAEDPIEYTIGGINQCEVNIKVGRSFERIIKAMLRQAPNIILVGEIRDFQTADVAVRAALTGHLVFSTLHTNDAPSAISRLINIGLKPFLVASSVQAVMAQRLLRKICPECKAKYRPDKLKLRYIGLKPEECEDRIFYRGEGCDSCNGVGYRGRLGAFEMMVMSTKLRDMTYKLSTTDELRRQAMYEGMNPLIYDGARKVLEGLTTVDEVIKVAKTTDEDI